MTKRELHEIAVTVKSIMAACEKPKSQGDDEILKPWIKLHGSAKGLRSHVRAELVEFWTNSDPYLDKPYLDYAWLKVGNRIVNLDDAWCFIRDGLEDEVRRQKN